jgi:hypothetical protein
VTKPVTYSELTAGAAAKTQGVGAPGEAGMQVEAVGEATLEVAAELVEPAHDEVSWQVRTAAQIEAGR